MAVAKSPTLAIVLILELTTLVDRRAYQSVGVQPSGTEARRRWL